MKDKRFPSIASILVKITPTANKGGIKILSLD